MTRSSRIHTQGQIGDGCPLRSVFAKAISYVMLCCLPLAQCRINLKRFFHELVRVLVEIGYWPSDAWRASNVKDSAEAQGG